jgi:hypothetical protein
MILSDKRILEEIEKGTIKIALITAIVWAAILMMFTWAKRWQPTKST